MYFFMMVGLPGSGKSTFVNLLKYIIAEQNAWTGISAFCPLSKENLVVLSTDNIIENIGCDHNMTYNELFGDITYSFAEKMMHKIAKHHFDKKTKYIIWDQTNLTVKSRAKKLAMVPTEYKKHCYWFPEPDDLSARLNSRPGKTIPLNVINSMRKSFEIPSSKEGFDLVLSSNQFLYK